MLVQCSRIDTLCNVTKHARVITGTFGHLNGSRLIAVSWLILHYGKLLG